MDVLRALGSFRGICHIYNRKNSRYSICTKQISEAVQFIKANYWYKVLQVISTRHVLHSFRHRPSALLRIRVLAAWLHKGLTVQPVTGWSDSLTLPSTAEDPHCAISGVPSVTIIDRFAGVNFSLWSSILIRDQLQERRSCQQPQQGAAQPSLVCWVLFACPALWSLLIGHHYTPHYPIRAWLEGETDHSGGWYALVSLNYTTPGPRLILVQSITANVSNGTDAHGEITTNIVQLTFSQGCLWPAREAQARSSTLDGSHSAVIVFLSGVLSVY